jgi:hypothetical protein
MGSRYFPTPAAEIGKATITASTGMTYDSDLNIFKYPTIEENN